MTDDSDDNAGEADGRRGRTTHRTWSARLRLAEAAHVRAVRERDEARALAESRRRRLLALERRLRTIVSAVAAADAEIGGGE